MFFESGLGLLPAHTLTALQWRISSRAGQKTQVCGQMKLNKYLNKLKN